MVSLFFDAGLEVSSFEEGREITVTLAEPLAIGAKITADILVEDGNRNTLNVLVPFRARNDRMPDLLINEIRTEGASVNDSAKAKVEFVEFIAKSSGNLGALRFFLAGNSFTEPVYEFPPTEVEAGEYIVLHLRTPSPDCVDETGTNIALSGGPESSPSARDFWVPGSNKLIHKDDILYLLDQDDKILDAVLLSTGTGASWGKTALSNAAQFSADQGAWFPRGGEENIPGTYILSPFDAVYSANTTNTRTICRDDTQAKSGSSAYWYIAGNSSATPGTVNSTKKFVSP